MKLKVNGVEVRVVDKIEIELDVAKDGEDLIHGIDVQFRGGPLTVRSIPGLGIAFLFHTQRTLFLRGRDICFSATNDDPNPPRLMPLGAILPWDSDGHGFDAHCEGGGFAIHMEADTQPQPLHQYRVFCDLHESCLNGEARHAQVVMNELAAKHGFTILNAQPQSVFGGWEFWIQSPTEPQFPSHVRILPFEPMPS